MNDQDGSPIGHLFLFSLPYRSSNLFPFINLNYLIFTKIGYFFDKTHKNSIKYCIFEWKSSIFNQKHENFIQNITFSLFFIDLDLLILLRIVRVKSNIHQPIFNHLYRQLVSDELYHMHSVSIYKAFIAYSEVILPVH